MASEPASNLADSWGASRCATSAQLYVLRELPSEVAALQLRGRAPEPGRRPAGSYSQACGQRKPYDQEGGTVAAV